MSSRVSIRVEKWIRLFLSGLKSGVPKAMAHDALSLHVKGLMEEREPVLVPSKLEDIVDDPKHSDAAAILVVSTPEAKYRSELV